MVLLLRRCWRVTATFGVSCHFARRAARALCPLLMRAQQRSVEAIANTGAHRQDCSDNASTAACVVLARKRKRWGGHCPRGA